MQSALARRIVTDLVISGMSFFEALKQSASASKLRSDTEVIYNGLEDLGEVITPVAVVVEKTEDSPAQLPVNESSNPVKVFSPKKLKAKTEIEDEPKIKCASCPRELERRFLKGHPGKCTFCYMAVTYGIGDSNTESTKVDQKLTPTFGWCRRCNHTRGKSVLKPVEGADGKYCPSCVPIVKLQVELEELGVVTERMASERAATAKKPAVQKTTSPKPALSLRQQAEAKKWGINSDTGLPYNRKTSPKAKGKPKPVEQEKPQKPNRKQQRAQAMAAGKQ